MPAQKKPSDLSMRVGELSQREDFGTGIARIDLGKAKEIGVVEGDIIEIRGKKSTAAVAMSCYVSDADSDIIRIDGITRRNCEANIGDTVVVRKAKFKDAQKLVISLIRKGVTIHLSGQDLNRSLLMRPFRAGDIFIPNPITRKDIAKSYQELFGADATKVFFSPSFEEKFVVISTIPEGIVRVVDKTEVEIVPGSYSEMTELEKPLRERVVNVKKCPELRNLIELRGMDDLKKLINMGKLVSRHEDDKCIIYFTDSHFLRIQKMGGP